MNVEMIEKLRDDEFYYNGAGRGLMSVSHIDLMTRTPESYIAFVEGRWSPPDNTSFIFGRALHTLVLEGEEKFNENFIVIDASTRNTNKYKEVEFDGEKLLLKETNEILRINDRLLKLSEYDETVYDLVANPESKTEEPNIIVIDGVMWKVKADKVNSNVIDLKSTSDISRFDYNASKYNYDAQAYLYSEAFGKDMKFVVVSKSSDEVAIADCSSEFLKRGQMKVELASQFYKEYITPALNGDKVNFDSLRNYITL